MLGTIPGTSWQAKGLLWLPKPSFVQPKEGALRVDSPSRKGRRDRSKEEPGLSLGDGRGEQMENQTPRE